MHAPVVMASTDPALRPTEETSGLGSRIRSINRLVAAPSIEGRLRSN